MMRSLVARRTRLAALVLGWLLAGSLMPASAAPAKGAAAPPFPFRIRGLERMAQLIGPSPSRPFAPYAPSPHSINDTTRWGICSGDLGSLIYEQGTAYIALRDNYTSCPPGTGGPGSGLTPPDWRSNALGIIPHPKT